MEESRVVAIPMGFSKTNKDIEFNEKRDKNILFIGRLEKKKSIDVLLRAFLVFSKENSDYKLILAGKESHGAEEIISIINELSLQNKVDMLGYISEEKKWELLKNSQLFVHPSAHEGSAIPVLEAWNAGISVITTDAPIMREVGRDAVVNFKAGSHLDLADKISGLVDNKERQKELVTKGQKYLSTHSWEKVSEEIIKNILY